MISAPYVILCSGQSNMARSEHSIKGWDAPDNLSVWNYDRVFGDERAATDFVKPGDHHLSYADCYAACIARCHPDKHIFLINISKGAQSLEQWQPNADSVNMLDAIFNNVKAALDKIPDKSTIDELVWWGHESDAAQVGGVEVGHFRQKMETVISSLDKQDWANSGQYPIHYHRIHRDSHQFADSINFGLAMLCSEHPERISLHDTTCFVYSDNIHLDADQKWQAASDVVAGSCIMRTNDKQYSRSNLLGEHCDRYAPGMLAQHVLEPRDRTDFDLPSASLAGQVITFSVLSPSAPLMVRFLDESATIQPSDRREFVAFYVPKALNDKIRVTLMPLNHEAVEMRNLKLEIGHGYSPTEEQ